MGSVEMLVRGLPNHQTTPINTTIMSKKRHTKEAQIKAIRGIIHGVRPYPNVGVTRFANLGRV